MSATRGGRGAVLARCALAVAAVAVVAGCSGDAAPSEPAAAGGAGDRASEIEQLLSDLASVDHLAAATLLDSGSSTADPEFTLVSVSAPDLPLDGRLLVRRAWAPRAGTQAVIGAADLDAGAAEAFGVPAGTLLVQLASPSLGAGAADDEPGLLWARYRAASPGAGDLDLARRIVADATEARGGAVPAALRAALDAAFPEPATTGAASTPRPGPSVLPGDPAADGLPPGTVAGQVVLTLPTSFGYPWVALVFDGRLSTAPTRVDAGHAHVISALPLGRRAEIVAWSGEEPEPGEGVPVSRVGPLTRPQSVVRVVPGGDSAIESQGDDAVADWLAQNTR